MIRIDEARRRTIGIHQLTVLLAIAGMLVLLGGIVVPEIPIGERAIVITASVIALLLPLLTARVATWEGERIVVRTLLGAQSFELARSAIGVRVTGGHRSPDIELRVESDDGRHAALAVWLAFGTGAADRAAAKLQRAIGAETSAEAGASLRAEKAARDRAQAQVDAYYRSPSWRITTLVIGALFVVLLAAAIAMAFPPAT